LSHIKTSIFEYFEVYRYIIETSDFVKLLFDNFIKKYDGEINLRPEQTALLIRFVIKME
jgi:histidyl-tRNA synthetase